MFCQDHSQDVKIQEAVQEVWGTESPSRSSGRASVRAVGVQSPQKLRSFQNSLSWSTMMASVLRSKGGAERAQPPPESASA